MCYNFGVKSKALLTISLCAVLAAAGGVAYKGTSFASAATLTTDYPDIFIDCVNDNLVGLVDFATDGESFAFADKNGIVVVGNGERTLYEISNVNALDCKDGAYYYRRGTTSYSLATSELSDYEFSLDYKFARLSDGSEYIIHTDDKCYFRAYGELSYSSLDGDESDKACYKLKVYDNVAYALLKSDTPSEYTVKKLDGRTCDDVNPSYIDFKGVEKVALGTIKNSLLKYNLDKPHFAKLSFDSYYTQINIYNLSGDYFDIGENNKSGTNDGQSKKEYTFKCGEDGAIGSDAVVLILGESGNAKVFTYNENCYIALSTNLTEVNSEQTGLEEKDFNAYLNAPDWLYSSPYICDATKAVELTAGDSVKVTGKVTSKIGGRQFYQVQFYDGDEQVTGYVLENFLNSYSEAEHPDDKNFGVIDDPHYSDDDLVKIVVLLLIVIALVLIGLTYITYVLTSKKRRALKQAEGQTDEPTKPNELKKE